MINERVLKRLEQYGIPKPIECEDSGMLYVDIAIDGTSLSYIPVGKKNLIIGDPYAKENRKIAVKSSAQFILNKFTNQQYSNKFKDDFELAFHQHRLISKTKIRKLIVKQKDDVFKEYLYYLTQKELIKHIKSFLKTHGIEYKQDDYGNIWSIRHEGKPTFVSHLDTVIGYDKRYRIPLSYYKVNTGTIKEPKYEIHVERDGFVLGGDDRAGVNLILNHIEDINFVFCLDEEVGRLGSKALSLVEDFKKDCEKTNFFIQLDRKGNSDILGNVHGYCTKELFDELKKILPNHSDNRGSYTDIDSFTKISQGVNLSIGYYKQHSIDEYLNIDDFNYINDKIPELAKVEGHKQTYEKPAPSYYGGTGGRKNRWSYGWDTCDECGCLVYDVNYYKGKWVCSHCQEKLEKEKMKKELMKNCVEVKSKEYGKCASCGKKHGSGDEVVFIKNLGITICSDCSKQLTYVGGITRKEGLDG